MPIFLFAPIMMPTMLMGYLNFCLAIGLGSAASVVYSILSLLSLPQWLTSPPAAAAGPLIGLASLGLYRLLRLHQPSALAQMAAACNSIGGALLATTVLMQLAVRLRAAGQPIDG